MQRDGTSRETIWMNTLISNLELIAQKTELIASHNDIKVLMAFVLPSRRGHMLIYTLGFFFPAAVALRRNHREISHPNSWPVPDTKRFVLVSSRILYMTVSLLCVRWADGQNEYPYTSTGRLLDQNYMYDAWTMLSVFFLLCMVNKNMFWRMSVFSLR